MKPNKTISILLTLIILLETLIPSLQSIAYGVEELIEEVESQSEEVVESEIEEPIDEVIEKENEEPSEDVSNLENDAVQEESEISKEEENIKKSITEEQEISKEEEIIEEPISEEQAKSEEEIKQEEPKVEAEKKEETPKVEVEKTEEETKQEETKQPEESEKVENKLDENVEIEGNITNSTESEESTENTTAENTVVDESENKVESTIEDSSNKIENTVPESSNIIEKEENENVSTNTLIANESDIRVNVIEENKLSLKGMLQSSLFFANNQAILDEPIINVENISTESLKNKIIKITVEDNGVILSDTNEYQYYLSSSASELLDGEWTIYESGKEIVIGEGITGIRYLFVKQISDNAGNVSVKNGTVVQIGGVDYLSFGLYKFDNENPTAIINAENMVSTDGLQVHFDGINNTNLTHSDNTGIWYNLSGNELNGSISNGVWGENYLEFNGNSTYADLGEINNKYQTLSVTFSADIDSLSSENCIIGSYEHAGGGISLVDNGYINGEFYINGKYQSIKSTKKVAQNKIYNVVLTYDGITEILYVNGVEVGRLDVTGEIKESSENIVLGGDPHNGTILGSRFGGKIYSTTIYNRALTKEEIISNYIAGQVTASGIVISDKINYTIKFDEKVTDFTIDDIEVKNGIKSNFVEIEEGREYILEVGISDNTDGVQEIKILANSCVDIAGNPMPEITKEVSVVNLIGDGTEKNPYILTKTSQLEYIIEFPTAHFKLGNNINLSEYENWEPISDFTGSLDGAGYTISNLTINSTNDYVGLFGVLKGTIKNIKLKDISVSGNEFVGSLVGHNDSGTIENIELENISVKGQDNVGGLVGWNAGTIEKCYATGSVTGVNAVGGLVGENQGSVIKSYSAVSVLGEKDVGGLVGYNNSGTIMDSYVTGSVTGTVYDIGGLVGENRGTVTNCYAIGKVEGPSDVGGLIGYSPSSDVTNSYWAADATMQTVSAKGTAATIKLMLKKELYQDWDFETIWAIDEGTSIAYLQDMERPSAVLEENIDYERIYDGTEENPYIITTAEQLNNIRNDLSAHYKLGKNIDLSGYENWEPIGNATKKFTGSLDGANKTISNLKIDANTNYVGLFGYSAGILKNIKLENSNVKGLVYTGALAGYNTEAIENIEVTGGKVIGTERMGGIVGYQEGNATSCIAKIDVEGVTYVGGMFGGKLETTTLCYATGNIKATGDYIGGLIGAVDGTVEKCYATGNVETTGTDAGGLIGNIAHSVVKNSYATGNVKGDSNVASIIGYAELSSKIENSYGIGKVEGTNGVGGAIGAISSSKSTATNVYWTPETTGQIRSAGGERKFLYQLQYVVSYKDWDFEGIWAVKDGEKITLAYLKDMPIPESIYMENLDPITYSEGDGSEENPFIIVTPRQLEGVNYGLDLHYKLGDNINLSGYENWEPIGDATNKFTGSLDGSNYTISNLKIDSSNDYVGLFGYSAGILKNIKLENSNVKGLVYTGALAGYNTEAIENIEVTGGKVIGTERMGGIVGYQEGNATSCIAKIDVEGVTYVGGMFGGKLETTTLCYATGNIKATGDYIGGLIGAVDGTVEKCYATGNVETTGTDAGGLIGNIAHSVVKNSYATGNVKGDSNVASIIGYAELSSKIENSYGIGKVEGTNAVGGAIGATSSSTATNVYWSPETTGQSISSGGTSLAIRAMFSQNNYENWDFENAWAIDEGNTLAYLKELPIPDSIKLENIDLMSEDGTEENPYIIRTAEELNDIRKDLTAHYKLGDNIDLSGYANWEPIGNSTEKFTGSLDGTDYTISNLKIDSSSDYVGLFGYSTGMLRNVNVNGQVTSTGNNVGGLVGYNIGTITKCSADVKTTGNSNVGGLVGLNSGVLTLTYATGEVIGSGINAGGLIGYYYMDTGSITQIQNKNYATGNVHGNSYVGGLIGCVYENQDYNSTVIENAYATGNVKGVSYIGSLIGFVNFSNSSQEIIIKNTYGIGKVEATGDNIGGLIGYNYYAEVTNSYWATDTTERTTSAGGTVTTIKEMLTKELYQDWDFETIWSIDEGTSLAYLQDMEKPSSILEENIDYERTPEGSGTEEEPYIIRTAEELNNIRNNLSAHYKLGDNINLSGYDNWIPIGDSTNSFIGSLDGDTYIISNITQATESDYNGLFGVSNGKLKNITLENVNVTGKAYTGTLVGDNGGTVENCKVISGSIEGTDKTGGLVGASRGTIIESSSTINVKGTSYVGGLVGFLLETISRSSATGNVEATVDTAGGLVGYIENTDQTKTYVTLCYATGDMITTGDNIGGLIGCLYTYRSSDGTCTSIVEKSYATGKVNGNENIGGLIGLAWSTGVSNDSSSVKGNLQINNTYATGEVLGITHVGSLIGNLTQSTNSGTASLVSSYGIGKVEGTTLVGGLVGRAAGNSVTATEAYWVPELTTQTTSSIGTERILNAMLYQSSYTNWDFENIWGINEDESFAYLKELPIPDSIKLENIDVMLGDGTEENPYIIRTAEELNNIRNNLSAHYKLGNNIDLSEYSNWTPIGNATNKFTGSFDGDEHTISNLKIDSSDVFVGLFGYNSGTIKNLELENVQVTGGDNTGSLVGCNTGTIENVNVIGEVTSTANSIGGLVGYNASAITNCSADVAIKGNSNVGGLVGYSTGTVNKSSATGDVEATGDSTGGLIGVNFGVLTLAYATGNVKGNAYVGGLIGNVSKNQEYNTTIIQNAYATGNVKGVSYVGSLIGILGTQDSSQTIEINNTYGIGKVEGISNLGGLIGASDRTTVTNSYWTPESTKQLLSSGGISTRVLKMLEKNTYTDWNFETIWSIDEGNSLAYLKELEKPSSVLKENIEYEVNGIGTLEDPYIIMSPEELYNVRNAVSVYYKLGANIDLSEYSNWTPIGNATNKFTGSFDGDEHTISNLKIDSSDVFVGLFGYNSGTIKNLELENVQVTGGDNTGSLVGCNTGTIENVNVIGEVTSTANSIGGLVGYNASAITNCSADVAIKGNSNVGGLVGYSTGTVNKSSATGDVEATGDSTGGLIGVNFGVLTLAYATGNVKGNAYVGGLIGNVSKNQEYNTTIIQNAYATGNVKGVSYVGSLIGILGTQDSSQTIEINNTYGIGKVEGISNLGGLIGASDRTTVTNSYWTPESTKQLLSSGGISTRVLKMLEKNTYTDWNFETIWSIDEGNSLAYLKELEKPSSVLKENIEYEVNGIGTLEDPYIIMSPEELYNVRNAVSVYYKLGADIDLKDYENWTPIGDATNKFTGSLDGANYTIRNLKVESGANYAGLFGYNTGIIKSVNVEGEVISTADYVGGLVGYNTGTITESNANVKTVGKANVGGLIGYSIGAVSKCSATGDVEGTGDSVGGLVGFFYNATFELCYATGDVVSTGNLVGGLLGQFRSNGRANYSAQKSYATGNVSGNIYVGGLIGQIYQESYTSATITLSDMFATGTVNGVDRIGSLIGYSSTARGDQRNKIINSYGIGKVEGTSKLGGLIGALSENNTTLVTNSYWTPETTTQYWSAGGTRNSLTRMQHQTGYKDWDFEDTWGIGEGEKGTLAYLKELPIPESVYMENIDEFEFAGGDGSAENPYIIMTPEQLAAVNYNVDMFYELGANIDLIGYENWLPIATDRYPFTGALDGKGYKISNLTITGNDTYRGLFGYNTGTIKNIELENVNIAGGENTGSLVGYNTGTIENIDVKCKVSGAGNNVGGAIGYNTGIIKSVNVEGEVISTADYVGGLVGYNTGTITESNANVKTVGKANVGGLIGYSIGAVSKCSATGDVEGTGDSVGGLVGFFYNATFELCYATGDVVSTGNLVGGLLGQFRSNGRANYSAQKSYATGNVSGNIYVGGLIGQIYQESYTSATITLSDMFATGTVNGVDRIGSLIGYSSTARGDQRNKIINSYGIGKVEGTSKLGGLIGALSENNTTLVTNSYWPPETTTQLFSGGGERTLLFQMQYKTGYKDWDFENTWAIGEGEKGTLAYLKELPMPDSVYMENFDPITFEGGDGSEENPFIIVTPKQLEAMNYCLFAYYKLGADIDLEAYENWMPIGDNVYQFTGGLDGDEYKITNLKITGESDYRGLFGYSLGKLKNIKLENVNIEGKQYVGGLVGYNKAGEIENCYVKGVVAGATEVGGLVGRLEAGNITDSYSIAPVSGSGSSVGGLVGYSNNSSSIIKNCYTTETVAGTGDYVGGLVGYNKSNITLCYTTGAVVGQNSYVGGLLGANAGTVNQSYAVGNVTGTNSYVGGFIGSNSGPITDCYETGEVSGKNNVGSFIGLNANKITNCYGIGKVTVTEAPYGGLIGASSGSNAKVTNSYWAPETVGIETSAGGEFTTIARMYIQNNYKDWNFDDIWAIDEDSIAYLKHIPKPDSVKVLDPDLVKPKNVKVKHIEETVGYSSATFEISAEDTYAGLQKFELYIDNKLVNTVTFDSIELGAKTATVTVEGIEGNADIHEYYVIATNAASFSRKSDYYRFVLKPLPIVRISSSNTDFTNQDIDIFMEANLAEGHIIEYRTSLDETENDWKTYTDSFKITENQTIYARVNDGINCGVESDYVVNNIDKFKPEFTGTYSRRQLTLNLKDIGTSGIKSYQYAILSEAPDKVNVDELEYCEEILVTEKERVWENGEPTNEFNVKINVRNTESNYVYVKVFDNAGNFELHDFGEYYIPGNIVNIEVENVSKEDEDIKLGGAKFELKVNNPYATESAQTITTNIDGLAKFQIFGREEGVYSYTITELKTPKGYVKINPAILKIEYNYYGEVLNATSLSADIQVEKVDSQLIKVKILNRRELGPDYQVAVKAVDEYNEKILLNDLLYRIEVKSEEGSNVSYTKMTGIYESGMAILSGLRSNGEIVIKVQAVKGIDGYIFDKEKDYTLVVNRNEETEEIVVDTEKSDFDVEYEIDYKHRTIIIIDKNRPKEIQSKVVLNIQNKGLDEISNVSGLEVVLEQPYGLGNITSKTDENGNVSFDDIIPLPEGEYLYKLFIKGNEEFKAKEIHLKVIFNDQKVITRIQEITNELASIRIEDKEDDELIYKIHNLNLAYDFRNELEYVGLKIQESDREEGFALEGITYKVQSSLADLMLVRSGTTDRFGELTTSIVKQDQVIIKVLETSMIDGYVLEPIEKTLVLDLNKETNLMEVNRELTDDTLNVEIEPNTGRIIIKETSMKKIELKDKANICFFITKADNRDSKLEGVKFKFEELVTGLSEVLETNKNGSVEYHDFKVSEVGTYTFVITELETVPGYKLWDNPIILDITYELIDDEYTASKIIVKKGYENIEYKHCDEYETETAYQLDVHLDFMNQKLDVPLNTMENIKFRKLDVETKELLAGVEFELNIVYEDGKSINQKFETDENGEFILENVDIPEGTTKFEVIELAAKPGYILDSKHQIITFDRNEDDLVINSEKIEFSEDAEYINLEIFNKLENLGESEGEKPEKPDVPDVPEIPEIPEIPDNPDLPGNPNEPGEPDDSEIKYNFDINIINENKYNPNLRLEGSSFNVKIKKYNIGIFNKNVTLSRYPLYKNTIELKNLSYEGDLTIEIKQITAPLHHTLNLDVYRLNISRDGSIGDIYLNGTDITDNAEVIIENDNMRFDKNGNRINSINNKIIIKIKNEPSEFMVGVTKLDAIETNIHLANAGFVVRKYIDVSSADLRTLGFIETDETGYGSTIVSEYTTNNTVLYTLTEAEPPNGYESAGTAGIYITTDIKGDIIDAKLSTSKIFAQTGFKIKQFEGKYIEFEVENRRKPLPSYKIVLEDSNSENEDVKVWGATYNVKVKQEIGADVSADIRTNYKGLATLNGLTGTRKIEIIVKQKQKAPGYLLDPEEYKVVIDREVSEIIQNGEKQVIHSIKLNDETDDNLEVTIDEASRTVMIKLLNEPDFGIFIEKVDSSDEDVRLNGGIFKLTSTENNDVTVETDYNGMAFMDLGKAVIDKTVKYTITEVKPPLGFEQIEPIDIMITFNDAGKMEKVQILGDRKGISIYDRTDSTFILKIDNREDKKLLEQLKETTFSLELTKHNLRNDDITVENVIFDIFVKSEDGRHKKAIKTSNADGKMYLRGIKGYGKITIELTELETARGYKLDDTTRIATLFKEKVDGKDTIRFIPEESSKDLRVRIDEETREVFIDIDNELSDYVLGLAIEKQDSVDSSKKLAKAGFTIKDEQTNEEYYLSTNSKGIGLAALPFHAKPGIHSYSIKEEKAPFGYNINTEILTLQVIYNENWELEKVQLLNGDGFAKVVTAESNYVQLNITNEAKPMIEPFDLVITKADWSDYQITIPDTLLSIDVKDTEYGLDETTTEFTDADGNIYMNELSGVGTITIDITELEPAENRRFDGLEKKATILRDKETGKMKLDTSLNVDTIIDNENRKVQVIVRNKELPGLFTVVLDKMDKETLEKMVGVEFELQAEGSSEAIKGVTDEEGRIEFTGLEMPGLGTYKYKLKEIKTLEGYKLLDEVSFDITFKAGDKEAGEDPIIIATAELMDNKENAEIVKVLPQYVKIDIFNEKVAIEESEDDIEKPEEDIEGPEDDIEVPGDEIEDSEDIEESIENIEEKPEDVLEEIFKDIENILQKEQVDDLDAFIKENFIADIKEEDYVIEEEKEDEDEDEKDKDEEDKFIDVFNLEDDKEYIIKSATKTGFTLMLGLLILVACLFRNLEIYVLTDGEYKLVKKLRRGRFNKKVDLSKYFDEDEDLNTIKLVMKNRLNKVLGGDKLEIKLQKQEFKRAVDKDEDEYIIVKTRTNREELPKEDDTELYEELDNELVEELDIEKELKGEKEEDNNSK